MPDSLPESADVTLAVYDALGRRVATLADGPAAAGPHEARFDAAGPHRAAQRLTVVR